MPCSRAHLLHEEMWAVKPKLLQWVISVIQVGSVCLDDAPCSLQLSVLATEPTGPWQSLLLSDQVSNDLLEAVQQPKAISQ